MAISDPLKLQRASTPAAPPTRARYGVLTALASMAFILYLDRVCIGQAAHSICSELGLTPVEWGYVTAAFLAAYGLFEIPTGWLGDRYGSRGVLSRIVIWWSLFTALTGMVHGLMWLLVVRFLFGAGEAGALPNAGRVLKRWFPESSRGFAQATISTSMLVGAAASPFMTARLIEHVGWRMAFVVLGSIGVFWAVLFYIWYRDDPATHPAVNQQELELIAQRQSVSEAQETHAPVPWELVLTSRNMWLMSTLMFCSGSMTYMLLGWYPSYLQDGRGLSGPMSGNLASLVLAGGALGCIVGGMLTDAIMRATGSRRLSRCALGSAVYLMAALAIFTSTLCASAFVSSLFVAATCFFLNIQVSAWWATVMQTSGRHTGALFGMTNSLSLPFIAASQPVLGYLIHTRGKAGFTGREQWDVAFYPFVGILFAGALLWLMVNPDHSMVEPRGDDSHATSEEASQSS